MQFNYSSLIALFLMILFGNPDQCISQNFKAAVVKKSITPDRSLRLINYGGRQSTGIHDSIFHRIIVMDDGDEKFFLVSTELCFISPSTYDEVAEILHDKYDIRSKSFWWSVTHTHSTPGIGTHGLARTIRPGSRESYAIPPDPLYTKIVVDQLVEGIGEAINQLEFAQLGVGWGYSNANINRRARDIHGNTRLGMNPDGAVDRRIGLLKITKSDDQSIMALIANYPIHGTVIGAGGTEISGDAPGIVSEYVESEIGAPLVFINGGAGNLAPIYSTYPSPSAGHLDQFKALLGDNIIKAQANIKTQLPNIRLKLGELLFRAPMKKDVEWPPELINYHNQETQEVNLSIRFLKINDDIGIWSAPLELFCEISNEIRDKSPFAYTFYFGYTNGWLGYLPTEEEFGYGGFEPLTSPFLPSAGEKMIDQVSSYLESELKSK